MTTTLFRNYEGSTKDIGVITLGIEKIKTYIRDGDSPNLYMDGNENPIINIVLEGEKGNFRLKSYSVELIVLPLIEQFMGTQEGKNYEKEVDSYVKWLNNQK